MITIVLADTEDGLDGEIAKVEQLCHEFGINVIVHHEDEDEDVLDIIDSEGATIIALTPTGDVGLEELYVPDGKDAIFIIGGFREGELSEDILESADIRLSLGPEYLQIQKVVEEIVDELESRRKKAKK